MEYYRWPPLKSTGKIVPVLFYDISKIVSKDLCSYSRICKKRQNHGLFQMVVMGNKQFSTYIFLSWRKFFRSLFLKIEKISVLSFKNQEISHSEWKTYFFQIWRSHFGDPPGTAFHTFFPEKIFCVKRPQLSVLHLWRYISLENINMIIRHGFAWIVYMFIKTIISKFENV